MNELLIGYNLKSPQDKDTKININVMNSKKEDLLFKYMIGCNGKWNTLKDFSGNNNVEWIPKQDGRYIVMVQARKKDSPKSFDYVSRDNYVIGDIEEKLISDISINTKNLCIGEKLNLTVNVNKVPLMFRYWIKINNGWEVVKDYSADNTLTWVAKSDGKFEILVECKNVDSENNFDDFETIEFEVEPLKEIQIEDFKCLAGNLIKGEEFVFQVTTVHEEGRDILYKFVKIYENGKFECIQNYSTRSIVNYVENESGNYKLLCFVKDMYSISDFDDRAIINFDVKDYKDIVIKDFTSDLNSPQLCETDVVFKADVEGGKELLYRYIVKGAYAEDSGYIRSSSYIWTSRIPGKYSISLWVKDRAFSGNYEACKNLEFIIDEKSSEPVKIDKVFIDKKDKVLINEEINVIVKASGGTDLRYSFILSKDSIEVKKIDYDVSNYAKFLPDSCGVYKLEIRVKDKYSEREFDSHKLFNIDVLRFIPANINYILIPTKDYFVVGDTVSLEIVSQNSSDTLIKYILKINNHKVEETNYVGQKRYIFVPKYSGKYTVEILAKNKKSDKFFDCKREVSIDIHECIQLSNTKISCNKLEFKCNNSITFTVSSEHGKDVLYEFFIKENDDWNIVQDYSKKNYYTFIPFAKGEYKILALAKSQYYKGSYEDYDVLKFNVL